MKTPKLLLILFVVINSTVTAKIDHTVPPKPATISVSSDQFTLVSNWEAPVEIQDMDIYGWKHIARRQSNYQLAGMPGRLISDVFESAQCRVERQIFYSENNEVFCIRNIVTNIGGTPFKLQSINPLNINGAENFRVGGNSPANWRLLLQYRLKNQKPETIVPTAETNQSADPFMMIGDASADIHLFIGYLSHHLHKASVDITFKGDNNPEFSSLTTTCDFEGSVVPASGRRRSQWVYITSGKNGYDLIETYADRVGIYHSVAPPEANAPSVYCTWYYHADQYNEELFRGDISAFRDKHMPFDVFLIDECWQLGHWGDFVANDKFPSGMKWVADQIRSVGYIPGIWTPPFLVDPTSNLAKNHPHWLLRNSTGERITFFMNQRDWWVIDPTYPGVCDYLEDKYRMLSREYGYNYFKFDFMRALFVESDQQLYDKTKTTLEAYRMGLQAIRRGAGDDAYLNVCGGHYGASLGIAQSQRSGSDVKSMWAAGEIPKYRQNILRTWMSRLWHVDPDAMMVRRSDVELYPERPRGLAVGTFTDDEARTNALNQYIGGGLVSFTEDFAIIDADRYELYKHVIPSINSSSRPIDVLNTTIPFYTVTDVVPVCADLDPWVTVAAVNWSDAPKEMNVRLDEDVVGVKKAPGYIVFEFFSQTVLGVYNFGEEVSLGAVPPHHSKQLRIAPWDGSKPVLAGTDLHFSAGGVEITSWDVEQRGITGTIETRWDYSVMISAVFPADNEHGFIVKDVRLKPGQKRFYIYK